MSTTDTSHKTDSPVPVEGLTLTTILAYSLTLVAVGAALGIAIFDATAAAIGPGALAAGFAVVTVLLWFTETHGEQ